MSAEKDTSELTSKTEEKEKITEIENAELKTISEATVSEKKENNTALKVSEVNGSAEEDDNSSIEIKKDENIYNKKYLEEIENNTKNNPYKDKIRIIEENGSLEDEVTDFIIRGKNGFEFPIKRIYRTNKAKTDIPCLAKILEQTGATGPNLGFAANLLKLDVNLTKMTSDARSGVSTTREKLYEDARKKAIGNGGYAFSFGAGWTLNLPVIRVNQNNITIVTSDGNIHEVDRTKSTGGSGSSNTRMMVYEVHDGDDFTVKLNEAFKPTASSGTTHIYWETSGVQLITKDGLAYCFDENLFLVKIYDPSKTNVIKIEYDKSLISRITDPCGNTIRFDYLSISEYVCSVISKIEFLDKDNKILSSLSYQYREQTDRLPELNIVPVLESVKDRIGRQTVYEYVKATEENKLAVYAYDEEDFEDEYISGTGCGILQKYTKLSKSDFRKKMGLEMPELLYRVTDYNGLVKEITYRKRTVKILSSEKIGRTPGSLVRIMAEWLKVKKGTQVYSKQFMYTMELYRNGQIIMKEVISDDSKIRIENEYGKYELPKRNGVYISKLDKSTINIKYKRGVTHIWKTIKYVWYENSKDNRNNNLVYRLKKETISKGCKSRVRYFEYDKWGNVTKESVRKRHLNNDNEFYTESSYTVETEYLGTGSKEISGFKPGFSSSPSLSESGMKNLLLKQKITYDGDDKNAVYKVTGYDTYGRIVWNGIYKDEKWVSSTIKYRKFTAENERLSGRISRTENAEGQIKTYSYKTNETDFITTCTIQNVMLYYAKGRMTRYIIKTECGEDIYTGLKTFETDGRKNRTSYTYDKAERLTSVTAPDGNTEWIVYDDSEKTVTVSRERTEQIHTVSTPIYVPAPPGVTSSSYALSQYITYDYKPRLKYYHDSNGNVVKKEAYNYYNGKEEVTTVLYEYDCYDRLCTYTDEMGNKTTYEYDNADRITKQTNCDGSVKTWIYDNNGNSCTITAENGNISLEYYDFDGLLLKYSKKCTTDDEPREISTVMEYNGAGKLKYKKDAVSQEEFYEYKNCFGKMSEITKTYGEIYESGTELTVIPTNMFSYDNEGRVKISSSGYKVKNGYLYRGCENIYNELGWILQKKTYLVVPSVPKDTELRIWDYELDSSGNIVKETNPLKKSKYYKYNELNLRIKETDECGNVTTFAYDRDGNLTRKTDANGFTFEYEYDDFGHLRKTIFPSVLKEAENITTTYEYDACGHIIKITESGGKSIEYEYNERGWKTSETVSGSDGAKTIKSWTYDGSGNILTETTGSRKPEEGVTTSYSYDCLDRLEKTLFADGRTEEYVYDDIGRVVRNFHADASLIQYEYNFMNRIIWKKDECNRITEYGYNIWGSETYRKEENENGSGTQISIRSYNIYNELTGEIRKDGRKWSYKNDLCGNVIEAVRPDGCKITFDYDDCGRIKTVTYDNGKDTHTITYTYDSVDNIIETDDDGIKSRMISDDEDHFPNPYGLIERIKTSGNEINLQTQFEYDESRLLSKITYPDSKSVTFGYSKIGLLKSIGNEDNTSSYAKNGTYGPTGHFKSLTAGNGKIFVNDWNPESDVLDGYEWGIDGKPDNDLTWNNRGNLIKRTLNGIQSTYEYDKLNQLTKEIREGQQKYAWTYDSKGNRLTEKKDKESENNVVCYKRTDLVKKDGNWNYNYDANGNLIAKGTAATATETDKEGSGNFEGWSFNAASGEVWHYEYDLLNRLIKVSHSKSGTNSLATVAEYKYDYRGFMVCRITGSGASKVTEYFAYDTDGKLIYTEKGTEKHDYIYANGKLWCEVVTKGNTTKTYYHHTDHLGTTICITDSTGKVVWECEHEAFGKCITKSSNTFTSNFTGKFLDEITNLYYFNARWYDSETGKFITEDPVRDGNNWYVYCRNNPLIYIDANGLTTLDDFNYQKRTEDSDKSIENQRKYDHAAREYAQRNQGLTDYGMAIHNNEEFFYNFLDKKFDGNNPLNQIDLDRALGFMTDRKSSISCMLAAIINAYAQLLKNGISGDDIINAIFDDGGNFNYFIGIDNNSKNGQKAPYCKGLWAFSKNIADTMDLRRNDFDDFFEYKDFKGDSRETVFLNVKDRRYWLSPYKNPDLNTPLIEGLSTSYRDMHYIFTYSLIEIDSLPKNRKNKPNYHRNSYYLLELRGR